MEIFAFLAELILQIFFELLTWLPFEFFIRTEWKSGFLSVMSVSCGILFGIVSVAFWPNHFIADPVLRTVNLVVTPVVIALFFSQFSRLEEKIGKDFIILDKAVYAYFFALSMALVRFCLAK